MELQIDRFAMNDQTEYQREAIAPFYTRRSTLLPSQQGGAEAVKPKRRRRKVRGGGGEEGWGKKRKLSAEQVNFLETNFGTEHKLESERKDRLATKLGLDPRQVAVWFQNRRARWKNKKLKEEYCVMKNAHESALLDKRRLESEVRKLKEQVAEAEKEMQRLCEAVSGNNGGCSSNSPSSSLTVEAMEEAVALGEFGVEGFEDVFYMPVQKNSNNHLYYI